MAFSGKATYDNTELIAEDVADVVSMISPFETFLLDYLGDAASPATNTLHEWVEDQLSPSTMVASTAINSSSCFSRRTMSSVTRTIPEGKARA